jgi:hypothetical protein
MGVSVKQEIIILEESFSNIKEVYDRYTLSNEPLPKSIENWCVIHTYPCEDTLDEDGNLKGYRDSLFFNIKVFDVENKICYVPSRNYDGIRIEKPCNIRYFKDLSVMYVFHNGVKIDNYQELELH